MPTKIHPINNPFCTGYWSEEERKKPVSHGSVSCDTMDLTTPVTIEVIDPKDVVAIAKEYGNFIAFHMCWVHPHLNGFRGYDCIEIKIKKIK